MNRTLIYRLAFLVILVSCSSNEESAQALLNHASVHEREGEREIAKKLLEKIVSDYPETETAVTAKKSLDLFKLGAEVAESLRKPEIAKLQVTEFEGALGLFRFDSGRYPTTQEGLQALIRDPGSRGWSGPYLKKSEVVTDPWLKPYHYRSPGQHGDYDLWSDGGDGKPGGVGHAADITSW